MNKKKTPQKLPNNVTEEEFLKVLDKITKKLGHKFKFGYHDFEDMKQQSAIFAMEGLQRYDNSRPLENFLWTHVRNRLFNYKRNNYQRPDKPCSTCPFYDKHYSCSSNQCSEFKDKNECGLYVSWSIRNEAKKNIMKPLYIEHDIQHSSSLINDIENSEIVKFLEDNISHEYRESYVKLKHGDKIPKAQLIKLQGHINLLMENFKNEN